MKPNYLNVHKNTIFNVLGAILPLLAAIYSIPILNKELNSEEFSLLLIAWAIIGYFSFFDFGVGRALTYLLPQVNPGEGKIISSYIYSGFLILLISSFIGTILVLLFGKFVVGEWYQISQNNIQAIKSATYICAMAVLPTTITAGIRGALEGLNLFFYSNLNRTILGLGMFISPVIAVKLFNESIIGASWSLLAVRILVMLIAIWQLRFYIFHISERSLSQYIKKIFNYGSWSTLSGFMSPILAYGDRLIIGGIILFAEIGAYATMQEMLLKLLVIPGAIGGALFYEFSSITDNHEGIKNLSRKFSYLLLILMSFIVLLIFILGDFALNIWLGPEFAEGAYSILIIMSIGIMFNSVAMIPLTILSATNNVKYIGMLHFYEVLIFIPCVFYFTTKFGLIGASLVWTGRAFIDFVFLKLQSIKVLKNSKNI